MDFGTTSGARKSGSSDLCAANGLKQFLKVRRCKQVTIEVRFECGNFYSKEITEKIKNLLSTELCKEREGVKTRKPRGQGKKALVTAKAAEAKDEGNDEGIGE